MTNIDMEAFARECSTKTRPELLQRICEGHVKTSLLVDTFRDQFREKPVYGGVFGAGGFVVASHAYVLSGLDRVEYYVMDAASGLVAGHGPTYTEAVGEAREALSNVFDSIQWKVYCGICAEAVAAQRQEQQARRAEEWEARRATIKERSGVRGAEIKSIPKRRREIYEASGGKCHYCETALTLDGRWHIEHKMPKALCGDNAPGNLVAACTTCNHEKRDQTDLEYLAKRAARKGRVAA